MKRALVMGLAGCAIVVGALFISSPTAAIGPNGSMLIKLEEAAARGDERAKDALADLERFAAQNGIDLATVASSEIQESKTRGHSRLGATGVAPFWVDIFHHVNFEGKYDLGAYVVERRAAALGLVGTASHRGQLSLTRFSDFTRLCELRDEADAIVFDAIVDVWLDGTWITRFGFGPDRPDFWQRDCHAVVDDVRSLLAEAHSDDALGMRVDQATLTLYRATLGVPTAGIGRLLHQDDVLLFDPEEDLLAPWNGRAATVRLVMPFDAFGELIARQVAEGRMAEPFLPGGMEGIEGGPR